MDHLEYKGYQAEIKYDEEDKIFIGRVIDMSDIIVFHAGTIEDLQIEMEGMIDFHLEVSQKKKRL